MKMKILFFLVFSGMFLVHVNAQKKCKFEYEKEDPLTGEVTKGTITPIPKAIYNTMRSME